MCFPFGKRGPCLIQLTFTDVPVEIFLATAGIVVKNLAFSPYTPSLNVKKYFQSGIVQILH